jgi:3-oxoacyl-[acyl-carrier protein] reductase
MVTGRGGVPPAEEENGMAGELLQNKVAIVTGGGAGIGRASSIMMAEHGARIVVDDIDGGSAQETVAAITAAGG